MDSRRRMVFPRINKFYNGRISKLSLTISNHKRPSTVLDEIKVIYDR